MALTPEEKTSQSPTASDEAGKHDDGEEITSRGDSVSEADTGEVEEDEETDSSRPPLPDEEAPPPLPSEAPPGTEAQDNDDGWAPVWDDNAQAFYFYNRFTGRSQWENPRVPEADAVVAPAPGTEERPKPARPAGGYDPAIHGDYDPNADYAKVHEPANDEGILLADQGGAGADVDPTQAYAATGTFNRFTGRWQAASLAPENFNDDAKSQRQMNAFFDVNTAANTHDGRSLKAERSAKKLSRKEVKAFREKRREKKEEKRRAWLRD